MRANNLLSNTRGATSSEYVIMLACVALLAISAWQALGTNVSTKVDCVAGAIGGAGGPCTVASAATTGGGPIDARTATTDPAARRGDRDSRGTLPSWAHADGTSPTATRGDTTTPTTPGHMPDGAGTSVLAGGNAGRPGPSGGDAARDGDSEATGSTTAAITEEEDRENARLVMSITNFTTGDPALDELDRRRAETFGNPDVTPDEYRYWMMVEEAVRQRAAQSGQFAAGKVYSQFPTWAEVKDGARSGKPATPSALIGSDADFSSATDEELVRLFNSDNTIDPPEAELLRRFREAFADPTKITRGQYDHWVDVYAMLNDRFESLSGEGAPFALPSWEQIQQAVSALNPSWGDTFAALEHLTLDSFSADWNRFWDEGLAGGPALQSVWNVLSTPAHLLLDLQAGIFTNTFAGVGWLGSHTIGWGIDKIGNLTGLWDGDVVQGGIQKITTMGVGAWEGLAGLGHGLLDLGGQGLGWVDDKIGDLAGGVGDFVSDHWPF